MMEGINSFFGEKHFKEFVERHGQDNLHELYFLIRVLAIGVEKADFHFGIFCLNIDAFLDFV
jgi:hypothetical protein